jgi:hypothetical protein
MAEVNVRLKVPAGYEREVKRFVDEVELKKKLLKDIASRSRLTSKDALSLSEEIKISWAAKHSS